MKQKKGKKNGDISGENNKDRQSNRQAERREDKQYSCSKEYFLPLSILFFHALSQFLIIITKGVADLIRTSLGPRGMDKMVFIMEYSKNISSLSQKSLNQPKTL